MDERNVGVKEILVVLVCDDGTTETIPATDVSYKPRWEESPATHYASE